jgi:hypothetical protein
LIPAASPPIADTENYPHLAIIGGGIEWHWLWPVCTANLRLRYMSDSSFEARSQGYGPLCNKRVKRIEGGYFLKTSGFNKTSSTYYRWKRNWRMGNEKMDAIRRQKLPSAPIYILHDSLALSATGTTRRTWCGKVGTPISRF